MWSWATTETLRNFDDRSRVGNPARCLNLEGVAMAHRTHCDKCDVRIDDGLVYLKIVLGDKRIPAKEYDLCEVCGNAVQVYIAFGSKRET